MRTIIYAVVVYCFLLLMMRSIGRRAPNLMTSFDMVLIFLFAGMSAPAIMRDERSFTNAILGIVTIGLMHLIVSTLKQKSSKFAKVVDGTPIVVFSHGRYHTDVMWQVRLQKQDVMAAARQSGIESEEMIKYAILERDGYISIIPKDEHAHGQQEVAQS